MRRFSLLTAAAVLAFAASCSPGSSRASGELAWTAPKPESDAAMSADAATTTQSETAADPEGATTLEPDDAVSPDDAAKADDAVTSEPGDATTTESDDAAKADDEASPETDDGAKYVEPTPAVDRIEAVVAALEANGAGRLIRWDVLDGAVDHTTGAVTLTLCGWISDNDFALYRSEWATTVTAVDIAVTELDTGPYDGPSIESEAIDSECLD